MLTKQDVKKIHAQMKSELNASPRLVVACALMLLLLFGLAWWGAESEDAPMSVAVESDH